MKKLAMLVMLPMLAACGVETASTAATGAAIKKQEMEDGKKAMDAAQSRIDEAMKQLPQRAEQDTAK